MVSARLPCGASSNAETFLQGGYLYTSRWLLQQGEHWDLFDTARGGKEKFPFYPHLSQTLPTPISQGKLQIPESLSMDQKSKKRQQRVREHEGGDTAKMVK